MTTTDFTAWLGSAADDMTPEQRARFDAEAPEILAMWPDPDDQAERDAALSALVQYLLGETSPTEAGYQLTRARIALAEALAAAKVLARFAVQDGMSEVQAAAQVGLDRMTVRKVLGK